MVVRAELWFIWGRNPDFVGLKALLSVLLGYGKSFGEKQKDWRNLDQGLEESLWCGDGRCRYWASGILADGDEAEGCCNSGFEREG
jgi:hypothetical protein